MSLVPCRECRAIVSEYADTCPQRGIATPGRVRIWSGVIKRALVVGILLVVFCQCTLAVYAPQLRR